jgi:hypothetical protein
MKQQLSTVGIDLAKRIFHLVSMDHHENVVLKKRLARDALRPFMTQLPLGIIGMEACGGPTIGRVVSGNTGIRQSCSLRSL